ncbi:uncharacterized protein LOC116015905 [Ipomoea triloba]|uniref:uncharacterized protein LOC116015905 n=1 Tax=Ipomoea triloba TaxID=35885 RepID=UPI00125E240D|nr:uncharacterized protein LOC116015905 [Ipomoea triloba]
MASHELICTGVRRRVGNGNSTLIWGHPWLPDEPDPMIQTIMPNILNGSVVSGLIDLTTGTWDHSIIQDSFQHTDVARILKVPVAPLYEDSWFWQGDPKGIYSVKEGYKRVVGDLQPTTGIYDKWLHLWKIKCPAKWKIFIWRALSNILPTTTNLIIKRVEIDPTCPLCGVLNGNVMHSLLLCDFSSLEDVVTVVATLYHIWKARNRAVWEASIPRPRTVWRTAQASAAAWRHAHPVSAHQQTPQPTAIPGGFGADCYCFVDAAYLHHTKTGAFGAVLLAHDGVFMAAFNGRFPPCFSPFMAESLACKETLSWLKDRGLTSVHIYTDCSTLKNLLSTPTVNLLSYVGFSIDASRAIMSSFAHCSVSFIPRTANRGAHVLATLALS